MVRVGKAWRGSGERLPCGGARCIQSTFRRQGRRHRSAVGDCCDEPATGKCQLRAPDLLRVVLAREHRPQPRPAPGPCICDRGHPRAGHGAGRIGRACGRAGRSGNQVTTLVGVVADTHCPEFLDRLPDSIFKVLDGVQVVLHAGDVNAASTLDELARIAPVEAVRGDHDTALDSLPSSREMTVEGRRIVLVHGNRSRWIEEPQTLIWTLSLGHLHPNKSLPRALLRRFAGADAIVFGHTHRAHVEVRASTLLFNPGGVHQWNPETAARRLTQKPGWFEWSWLQFSRHLRRYPAPSVGILEVTPSAIVPTVVEL